MIYSPQHGDTAFTVPLFDAYMRRAMKIFDQKFDHIGDLIFILDLRLDRDVHAASVPVHCHTAPIRDLPR